MFDIKESEQQFKVAIDKLLQELAEHKLAVEKLKQSEEHFRTLVETIEDYAIFALSIHGLITSWNEGVEYILGYTQEEIIGMHFHKLHTEQDIANDIPSKALNKNVDNVIQEGLRIRKDGSIFNAVVTTTPIRDEQGELKGFSQIIRDVTEKKEAEETIHFQAFHDFLTGLPNRESFYNKFELAQASASRNNHKLAVVFIDLDRFKIINDTLGHAVGDLILKEVADRLTKSVRKNDTVARLGGDEFILLINEVGNPKDVVKVCKKIISNLGPVLRLHNHSLHVSASFGIALFPDNGENIQNLLKNADIALYKAKTEGRSRYQFYNYELNLQSSQLFLEQDLRRAVEETQLEILYQPFVRIKTGEILGVEALVRWNHPRLGLLYPKDFITIAEETGVIVPMGKWILETVCRQGKYWHDFGLPLTVSVNLSARQFAEDGIVNAILQTLEQTQLDPKFLELEITESIAMENANRSSNKLAMLRKKGVAIAIDDFGTGYSSLSYLKRFPAHKLKIDRSFIKHALTDSYDLAIVRAIIYMGKSLDLQVCAEGVENKKQLELLNSMGCEIAQGYLICKPVPANNVTLLIQKKNARLF